MFEAVFGVFFLIATFFIFLGFFILIVENET